MKITHFDIAITRRDPSPNPKRDALQSLPGSGSVKVTLETGLIPEGSPLQLEDGYVSIPNGPGFSWA